MTVKRGAFFFPKDHEYASGMLKRLVERRNEFVHGRQDFPNMEASLHHARWFVECAIEFLLDNKYGFRSHREFLEFLELPRDLKDVGKRLRLLAKAKSHLQPIRDRKRVTELDTSSS